MLDNLIRAGAIVTVVVVGTAVVCGAIGTIGFGWSAMQEERQSKARQKARNKQ